MKDCIYDAIISTIENKKQPLLMRAMVHANNQNEKPS